MAKMGPPTKLTPEVRETIAQYLIDCTANNKVPTVARLEVILNISKKTLYNWSDNDKDILHTLEQLQSIQEATLVEGSLENRLNPTISKLMLANHGYREKSEQDITSGGQTINQVLVKFVGEDDAADQTANN